MIPTIKAGITLVFDTEVTDYPPTAGWTLAFYLRGPGVINLTTTSAGTAHRCSVAATSTATWTAGSYAWEARVSNGAGLVYDVGGGTVQVTPDITTATAGTDLRSQAEKALEAALAALAAWTPTYKSHQIGDRTVVFNSPEEIQQVIRFWEGKVADERAIAAGRAPGPLGRISFGVPQ